MLQAKKNEVKPEVKNDIKNKIFFAIKTMIFTIALFSAISLLTTNNVQDIALSQVSQHESASSDITTYKKKFQVMCVNNILTCIRIDYDGDYDYKEKYFYLASVIHVSKFIDKNISSSISNNNFSKTIKEITLKSDGGKRRGYATKNNIEINTDLIDSYTEFIEILTHEAAHIVDLGMIQGKSYKKDTDYTEFGKAKFAIDDPSLTYYQISFKNETTRKASADKEEFCSRYGMTDPFEDFAECVNLYVNHHNIFRYMASNNSQLQKKYDFINILLQGNYLKNDTQNNSKNLKKIIENPERRTRDTTKL